ncbi:MULTISPECIES: hypothetical protein [unclassified Synechococcus]|uniref:hypothetical protein n=1 Tax=unclassified Synechococcus TaxID=2626047 RepID=UPI0012E88F61|nr:MULTISPECIES: hypothetical protein [unclassified Synechococcus]
MFAESNVNLRKILNKKTARKLQKWGYKPQEINNELPGLLPFELEETNSSAPDRPTTPAADVDLTAEEFGDGPGSLDPVPEMPGTPDGGGSNPTDPGSSVPGGGGSPNPNPDGSIPGGGGSNPFGPGSSVPGGSGSNPTDPGSSVPGGSGSNPTDPGSSVPGNSGTDPITGVSAFVDGTASDGSALVPAFFGPFQAALSNSRALKVRADLLQTDWESLNSFEFSPNSLGGDLTNLSKGFDPQIGFEGNLFSGINQSNFWKNSLQSSTNNFMDL